jgi:hypothetical protein
MTTMTTTSAMNERPDVACRFALVVKVSCLDAAETAAPQM